MVIEDDTATLNLVKDYIEYSGYTCECGDSVQRGREILSNTIPSIIILDILLPNEKGYELIKPVRSNPSFDEVIIYFLTAIHRPEALQLVEKYGVDGLITKPFNLQEFDVLFGLLKQNHN